MSRYRFVQAERATYPIAVLCRVLRVARAGHDAWARRGVSARARADAALAAQIARIRVGRRRACGVSRVHAALRPAGVRRGSRRVARLMRAADLVGRQRHRRARTTVADPAATPAANLVARDSAASAPIGCGSATAHTAPLGKAGAPWP